MKRSLKQWSEQILEHWQDKLDENEWYFAEEEERLLYGLEPWEAFELIPQAVDLVMSTNHDFIVHEFFNVLQSLYRISKTTEIHPYLITNWDALVKHMSGFGDSHSAQLDQLRMHLRLQ